MVVGSLTNNQIRCPSRPISNPPNAEAAKSIRCFVGTAPLLSRCTRVAIAAYGKVHMRLDLNDQTSQRSVSWRSLGRAYVNGRRPQVLDRSSDISEVFLLSTFPLHSNRSIHIYRFDRLRIHNTRRPVFCRLSSLSSAISIFGSYT